MPQYIPMPGYIQQYPNNPKSHPPESTAPEFKKFKWNWPMEVIDAPGAWLVPLTETEITLAAVDSGLYMKHQDLEGVKILAPPDMSDESGHGTAVMGIVAAKHNTGHGMAGLCPDITVYPLKVVWEYLDYPWAVLQHDEFSQRHKLALSQISSTVVSKPEIKIVIMPAAARCQDEKQAEDYARYYFYGVIEHLLIDEVIVVIGPANDNVSPNICYPAVLKKLLSKYPNLFLVSGCTRTFNCLWGRDMAERFSLQKDVDIFAPGDYQHTLKNTGPEDYNIPPDLPGATAPPNISGNSFALPYVGGLAALLFKINPSLSATEVSGIIRQTAEVQDRGQSAIKVINAFAAALTAHNLQVKEKDKKLKGYRLMLPLEYAGGYVQFNEKYKLEIFALPAFWQHSFCRFISADPNVNVEVYLNDPTANKDRLRWKGSLQEILNKAKKDSDSSAWKSKGCEELNTLWLQGLALKVCSDSPDNSLRNAGATLLKTALYENVMFQATTDNDGYLVIPFGEPGIYTLTVIEDLENNIIHEVNLELNRGQIYTVDPRFPHDKTKTWIAMGKPNIAKTISKLWSGDILYQGIGQIYKHLEGGPFNDQYNGNIFNASGEVKISASVKVITKKNFLIRCGESLFGDGFEDDSSGEDISDDLLPDYNRTNLKISSTFLHRLQNNFQEDLPTYDFESDDWIYPRDIPPGFVLSSSEMSLDFQAITNKILELHFKGVYKEGFPYTIDVTVCWCADASKLQEEECEFLMNMTSFRITPRIIPLKITPVEDFKYLRVMAGPCAGEIKFFAHPSLDISFLPDKEDCPTGYASRVIENKASDIINNIFAVGSRGEIGVLGNF